MAAPTPPSPLLPALSSSTLKSSWIRRKEIQAVSRGVALSTATCVLCRAPRVWEKRPGCLPAPPPFLALPPVRGERLRKPGPDDQRGTRFLPPESLFPLGMDDEGPPGIDCWGGTPEEPDTVFGPLFLEDARNLSP